MCVLACVCVCVCILVHAARTKGQVRARCRAPPWGDSNGARWKYPMGAKHHVGAQFCCRRWIIWANLGTPTTPLSSP